MKAYCTYPSDPSEGCCLVYANTRNQARMVGLDAIPWFGTEYTSMRAVRRPDFDKFVDPEAIQPYEVLTNKDLPEAAPDFYNDEGENICPN